MNSSLIQKKQAYENEKRETERIYRRVLDNYNDDIHEARKIFDESLDKALAKYLHSLNESC